MKNNLLKTLAIATVGVCFAATNASALPIEGTFDFAGGVTFDTNITTANKATSFAGGTVQVVESGSTFDIEGLTPFVTPVSMATSWTFDPALTPINLWTAGGFSFTLTSIIEVDNAVSLPGVLYIEALGNISHDDYLTTPALFTFSVNFSGTNPSVTTYAYSASVTTDFVPPSVPDGGTTAALLGAAMIGLFFVSRRLAVRA